VGEEFINEQPIDVANLVEVVEDTNGNFVEAPSDIDITSLVEISEEEANPPLETEGGESGASDSFFSAILDIDKTRMSIVDEVGGKIKRASKMVVSGALSSPRLLASAFRGASNIQTDLIKKGFDAAGFPRTPTIDTLLETSSVTDLGEVLGDFTGKQADKLMVKNPNIFEEFAHSAGLSALTFIPAFGTVKLGQMLSMAPKIAASLGVGVNVLIDSALEAGAAREETIQRGEPELADINALKVFTYNVPLNIATDIIGGMFFPESRNVLKAALGEMGQEGLQSVGSQLIVKGEVDKGEAFKEAAFGGVLGGGAKTVSNVVFEPKPKPKVTPKPKPKPEVKEKSLLADKSKQEIEAMVEKPAALPLNEYTDAVRAQQKGTATKTNVQDIMNDHTDAVIKAIDEGRKVSHKVIRSNPDLVEHFKDDSAYMAKEAAINEVETAERIEQVTIDEVTKPEFTPEVKKELIKEAKTPEAKQEMVTMIEDFRTKMYDMLNIKSTKNIETLNENQLLDIINKAQEGKTKEWFKKGKAVQQQKDKLKNYMQTEGKRIKAFIKKETKRIVARISKPPSKGTPIGYKDQIEQIQELYNLKKRTTKTLAKRERLRSFMEQAKATGEMINIPQELIDDLGKVPIENLLFTELMEIDKAIEHLRHLGSIKGKLLAKAEQRSFGEIAKEGISNITKGEMLSTDTAFEASLVEKGKIATAITKAKGFVLANIRPERLIKNLDSFKKGGINTKVLWKRMWDAAKSEMKEGRRTLDKVKDIHKELDITEMVSKKHKVGRFKSVTKDTMMFVYAHSFNPESLAHLKGSGLTSTDIKLLSDALSPAEKQAVHDMFDFYENDQWVKLNEVHMAMAGTRLEKTSNYFSILGLTEGFTPREAITAEAIARSKVRKAGTAKGFIKTRGGSELAFKKFSYLENILQNWKRVEHHKAFTPAIRDVVKYLNDVSVKKAIVDTHGQEYWNQLDIWTKDVAYGGNRAAITAFDKVARFLRTNYVTAVLGYNLTSMARQPVSIFTGMNQAGMTSVARETAIFLTNPRAAIRFAAGKSVLMANRPSSFEREMIEILSQKKAAGIIGDVSTWFQKFKEGGMIPIQKADQVTTTILWIAVYKDAWMSGLSEEVAIDLADELIRNTQPMGGTLHLPGVFRGSELQKLYTTFKNQLNQNPNVMFEEYQKFGGDKTFGSFAKFMKGGVMTILIPAYLMAVIKKRSLDVDPIEMIQSVLNSTFGGVPFIGHLFQDFGSTTPLDSLVQDVIRAKKSRTTETAIKNAVKITAKVTGTPLVTQILKGEKKTKSLKKGAY